MGRVNAPLEMYGMVNALYKAANNLENIWGGGMPHMHKNWDENNAPLAQNTEKSKELILLIE